MTGAKPLMRAGEGYADAGAGTEVTVMPVMVRRDAVAGRHAGCHDNAQLSPSAKDDIPFEAICIKHSQMTHFNGYFEIEPMPACRF
jgi:hypothetical protein